jgi:hypothetical protein
MHQRPLFLSVSLALFACGSSGESSTATSEEPSSSSGTSGAEQTTEATAFGNEAVRARLATLPASPIPLETRVLDLEPTHAVELCTFLDHLATDAPESATSCPDGSPVVVGGTCNPANLASAIETLGEACPVRVGEYVACELAVRADPCSVEFMRANRAECEAVNACLVAAAGGT